jgi:hypothetical protein
MCLSLTLPPNRILARLDVRTTLSKKFNERCRASTGRPLILRIGAHARRRRCADPRRTVTRKPDVRVISLRRISGDRRSARRPYRAAEVLPFPILKIDRLHELHRTRRAGLYACVPTSGGNLMVVV